MGTRGFPEACEWNMAILVEVLTVNCVMRQESPLYSYPKGVYMARHEWYSISTEAALRYAFVPRQRLFSVLLRHGGFLQPQYQNGQRMRSHNGHERC